MSKQLSLPKDRINILLLEGIHPRATETFARHGYASVETLQTALDEAALIERIEGVHMLGIRSRTKVSPAVFEAANRLFCIGCFCIGTDQVDLRAARSRGIPVFNAPYSNTRSVAELVLAEIIMLMRGIPQKSAAVHRGEWPKSATHSHEIRGKTLGIVGYGHIGTQLSVLAESAGMKVRYFDIVKKLAIGNAEPCHSLEELLGSVDVVTLHVPDTPQTREMIGARALQQMRPGSYLINASRGGVVVIEALAEALRGKHLRGAAIDVFPKEPGSKTEPFESPLRGMDTVILTPHIGGSTEEAQENIGIEVGEKLCGYSDNGSTIGTVNFPQVSLPVHEGYTRFLHIHRNEPGVLRSINTVFSDRGLNLTGQYLQTDPELGYVVVDVAGAVDETELLTDLRAIRGTIRTRMLY